MTSMALSLRIAVLLRFPALYCELRIAEKSIKNFLLLKQNMYVLQADR